MSIDISFIIPHKGRIELLAQTIESIIQQDFDLSRVEIIVVTQNTDMQTSVFKLDVFENLIVLVRPESDTISALRNTGVDKSKGEYLAFLDADIELSKNWLATMLAELQNPDYILVSASQTNSGDAPPLERIRTALSNAELDTEVNFLLGRNLLLRKIDFHKTAGFPEHLVTCEDYYFTDQPHHFGKLFYTSKAKYVHLGEDKQYHEMFKKEIWRGQSNLLSIKGRKIPLREIPSIIVPLAVIILLILGIVLFVMDNTATALTSLFLYLSYTLRLIKLVNVDVKPWQVVKFYSYYFPARAYGTVAGLFLSLSLEK